MSLSSEAHSTLRAALQVADYIDPSGRFRAILHLVRCLGGEHLEEILSLSVGQVASSIACPPGETDFADPADPLPTDPSQVRLDLGGSPLLLDAEGQADMSRFLHRRKSYRRVTLFQRHNRGCRWYILVRCAGGHARRSLRTKDEQIARRRATRILLEVTRTARERDPGWLFPSYAMRRKAVTPAQFRIWLNQAVGRQGPAATRRACLEMPLFRKAKQRRARDQRASPRVRE